MNTAFTDMWMHVCALILGTNNKNEGLLTKPLEQHLFPMGNLFILSFIVRALGYVDPMVCVFQMVWVRA